MSDRQIEPKRVATVPCARCGKPAPMPPPAASRDTIAAWLCIRCLDESTEPRTR